MTERRLVNRRYLKIVRVDELLDGHWMHEVYVVFRGRGICLSWGSAL
jgi:hypothetical protein